jgi:hypothetical protein
MEKRIYQSLKYLLPATGAATASLAESTVFSTAATASIAAVSVLALSPSLQ